MSVTSRKDCDDLGNDPPETVNNVPRTEISGNSQLEQIITDDEKASNSSVSTVDEENPNAKTTKILPNNSKIESMRRGLGFCCCINSENNNSQEHSADLADEAQESQIGEDLRDEVRIFIEPPSDDSFDGPASPVDQFADNVLDRSIETVINLDAIFTLLSQHYNSNGNRGLSPSSSCSSLEHDN